MKTGKKTPCAECPFRRDIEPGKLGGATAETYIGQAEGPFWLPCHMSKGYAENRTDHAKHEQCAGAAMYRDAVGCAEKMPPELLKLPKGPEVFSSHAEFLAHHRGMPLSKAEDLLKIFPPVHHMVMEFMALRKKMQDGGAAFITPSTQKV